MSDLDLQSVLAACRLDPEIWWRHFAVIRKDNAEEVIGPEPTSVQLRIFAHYRRCRKARKPCKMLVYKSRRHGATTGSQGLLYWHGQTHKNLKLKTMAHKDEAVTEVLDIFNAIASKDKMPWIPDKPNVTKSIDKYVELSSGSSMMVLSAQADEPGRGGAAQGVEITEVAHYKETGAKDPLTAFLQSNKACLVDPIGLIIGDSTPAGSNGWFYEMVCGNKTSPGILAKKRDGSWTLDDWEFIFEAWWTLPDSRMLFGSQDEFDDFTASIRPDEQEELDKYGTKGVTMEALKWRRHVIDSLLKGDPEKFKQEYPSDPIEGFLGAGRPRFNMPTLIQAKDRANGLTPRVGNLQCAEEENDSAVMIDDPRGELEVLEEPRWGLRYLVSMDSMTGEDQTDALGKHEPDSHAIHVWRDAYEENGMLYPAKLVARHSSQLDIYLAAEIARKAAAWYGGCIIIPEVNNCGLAAVKYLQSKGANVYSRRQMRGDTETIEKQLGWKTDPVTRKTIIDHLAREWREGRVEILFAAVLEQMQVFVSNRKGKYEALPGKHDDEVLAAAIGVYNLPHACERRRPKRKRFGGSNSPDSFRKVT